MKKNIYTFMLFILGINLIYAKPVTPVTAKSVAISYYKQHSAKTPETVTLAYTETSPTGEALYYVFNINANDGFVIISADDVAHPIIGYSTERQYVIPDEKSPIGYWMKNRKKELLSIKTIQAKADAVTTREWAGDFSATSNASNRSGNASTATTMSVAPLTTTTWNQNPYYNGKCPGTGSKQAVTGCVATTMAQIMRFWSYPAKGIGSSSYIDSTTYGYKDNYGILSASYGSTNYSWTNMPNSISAANVSIETLMLQCGISVDMDYDPAGSGAQVLALGGSTEACAQNSYVNYFGYDASKIQGYQRTTTTYTYTDAAWLSLIETDLTAGRPVEYAGADPTEGGHTWVCDGFEANNYLHMNWGWGGSDNGYFSINNLLTTNGGFNPSTNHQILVGIQPPPTIDAGITAINKPTGVLCAATFTPVVTLKNFGINTLTSCTINYQLDGGTVQTYSWTGSLTTFAVANVSLPAITVTAGTHTLSCASASPNKGADGNSANDNSGNTFVYSPTGSLLPVMEGFESAASLPTGWSIGNPNKDAVTWQVVTTVAHTGTNCVGFNDCDGDGSTDMTGHKDWLYTKTYDFSTATAATFSFDVAYIPASDSAGHVYTDSLALYYSINCGVTWTKMYQKGGMTLATAPVFTIATVNCMAPTSSSQWRTDAVTLPAAVLGQSSVEFGFESISDWGDWIYLDNINITATNSTTGIASHANSEGITVYPNPAHNNLFINVSESISSISVTNVIGQTVIAEQRVNSNQQVQTLDISNLADGVYFVKVNSTDSNPKIIRFIKN